MRRATSWTPADAPLVLPRDAPPARPRAAVLLLHGGRAESLRPARPWHLAAVRMRLLQRALRSGPAGPDVLYARVGYRYRGWNGERADPVRDAQRALDMLAGITGAVPTVLVGHSMGGRAALRVAGAPHVRGVVALAPWCPAGEPVEQLRGRRVVVLHGERDRITFPADSAGFVRRARSVAHRADMALVAGGDHAMLRRASVWHRAVRHAVESLLGPDPDTAVLPYACCETAGLPLL
ncbi:alpha/beta hydrolase [Streptomyces albogriseolus]|uniref:alpha/beta hydrolase n=1 Tax=Streptomyces TaxID=1883 RepID=UPI002A74914D|nr:alpha/beta fold hydrolase [Streptomyces sp. CL7]WPP32969.1 alpha/beta fold hydrolase [Streptomyces sp. CL7]